MPTPTRRAVIAAATIAAQRPYQRSWTCGRISRSYTSLTAASCSSRNGGMPAAAAFPRTCSGFRAPGMTVLTPGCEHPPQRELGERDVCTVAMCGRAIAARACAHVSTDTP
jgi:hypothetical protein